MKIYLLALLLVLSFPVCYCQINQQAVEQRQKFTLDLPATTPKKRSPLRSPLLQAVKIPTILIGAGIYSTMSDGVISRHEIREERNEIAPNFHTTVDNYLMHAPVFVVYGLNMAGVKGKHDFRNRTILLVKSEMIMAALVFSTKSLTNVARPDNSDHFSFPSGHTAQAFATATFMSKEYGDQSVWYSVGAYSMATAVGAFRILNNRHWVSDVMTGAGIGILSTNLAYLTHRYKWKNKNSDLTIIPTYAKGPGLYVAYKLN